MPRSLMFAAAICCAVANPKFAQAQIDVSLTPVAEPIWRPSQVHLFSAPAATDEEFLAVVDSIRDLYSNLSTPPYDTVLDDAMAAAGYVDQSVYPTTAIDGQNGSYLAMIVVPDPGIIGSSPNFDSGPVIPTSVFPIRANNALLREGQVVDEFTLSNGGPGNSVDGAGLGDFFFESDANFFPPDTRLTGSWEWNVSLRDSIGNGWDIAVPFQVSVPGDANLDGQVNATDLNALALNWRSTFAAWSHGDFNGDSKVDALDLNTLALNWQHGVAAATAPAVPEPSSITLLLLGLCALVRRAGGSMR